MTEREALLAAVCANPDDDTPRLVFADWLQENGEPERAEFIRLQCLLHLFETGAWKAAQETWAAILARGQSILDANHEIWERELSLGTGLSLESSHWHGFERGFAQRLTIWDLRAGEIDWDRILSATPLTVLELNSVEDVAALLTHPATSRLRTLDLVHCNIAEQDLLTLADRARFLSLESLRVCVPNGRISPTTEQQLRDRFGHSLVLERDPIRVISD